VNLGIRIGSVLLRVW